MLAFSCIMLYIYESSIREQYQEDIDMKEKVILAYSGGLDTTTIIPWLKENFGYEVMLLHRLRSGQ